MSSTIQQAVGGCQCPGASGHPGWITCVTCGPSGIPPVLSITDSNGSYAATWNSAVSLWVTGILCAEPQSPCALCSAGESQCDFGVTARQPQYGYSIGCSSANQLTLNRFWYEQRCVSPAYQYCPCGCVSTGTQAYSTSGSVAVTCGAVAWSGTLSVVLGHMSDPVGGTTTFSQ